METGGGFGALLTAAGLTPLARTAAAAVAVAAASACVIAGVVVSNIPLAPAAKFAMPATGVSTVAESAKESVESGAGADAAELGRFSPLSAEDGSSNGEGTPPDAAAVFPIAARKTAKALEALAAGCAELSACDWRALSGNEPPIDPGAEAALGC